MARTSKGGGTAPVDQLERRFSRMGIARRDFVEAEEFLSSRSPQHSSTIDAALLVAALVSYARPFKRSDTSGMSTETLPQSALRVLSVDHRELHDHLISIRDEAIAHSSFSRRAALRIQVSMGGGYVATSERRFDIRKHIASPEAFLTLVRTLVPTRMSKCFGLTN